MRRSRLGIVAVTLLSILIGADLAVADTELWSFRGGAGAGPENTIEGINLAHELGATGTEIDLWHAGVTLGAPVDPEIVVTHYRDISVRTNGTGFVQDLSYDYLQTLDAGSSNGATLFPGAKIPTFDETLDFLKERDMDVLLHVKTSPFGLPGTVPTSEIAAALEGRNFPDDNVFLWDDSRERIADYVAGIPNVQVIYQGDIDPANVDWQELIDLGVSGIQVRLDNQQFGGDTFNQAFINDIHANGLFAFINAPNGNEFLNAIEWEVDYVQTTRVEAFAEILAQQTAVPEPGSLAILSLVSAFVLGRRNRKAA